ncbi:MAG: hypothetical protein MUP36_02470 [Demequinaceae bacterium]|nr:hypothetical protein [Demequinaceae bacterium]
MSQDTDSWLPEDPDDPQAKPALSWEEISPESLRQSALSSEVEETAESDDSLRATGMAWFEIILGTLLGLVAMVAVWYWSDGALGVLVVVPALVFGVPLVLTKRRDLRYLGYGMLVAIPVAVVLGIILWYLTLFI